MSDPTRRWPPGCSPPRRPAGARFSLSAAPFRSSRTSLPALHEVLHRLRVRAPLHPPEEGREELAPEGAELDTGSRGHRLQHGGFEGPQLACSVLLQLPLGERGIEPSGFSRGRASARSASRFRRASARRASRGRSPARASTGRRRLEPPAHREGALEAVATPEHLSEVEVDVPTLVRLDHRGRSFGDRRPWACFAATCSTAIERQSGLLKVASRFAAFFSGNPASRDSPPGVEQHPARPVDDLEVQHDEDVVFPDPLKERQTRVRMDRLQADRVEQYERRRRPDLFEHGLPVLREVHRAST